MTPEIRGLLGAKRAEVRHLINHALRMNEKNHVRLARELGLTTEAVSKVIRGQGHSPVVLDALAEAGVPEELLFDPRRAVPAARIERKKERKAV